jgi:hypothetical protein
VVLEVVLEVAVALALTLEVALVWLAPMISVRRWPPERWAAVVRARLYVRRLPLIGRPLGSGRCVAVVPLARVPVRRPLPIGRRVRLVRAWRAAERRLWNRAWCSAARPS